MSISQTSKLFKEIGKTPCPVCGHADRCKSNPNRDVILCFRATDGAANGFRRIKTRGECSTFILTGSAADRNGRPTAPRASRRTPASLDLGRLAAQYRAALDDESAQRFALELGLSVEALRAVGAGLKGQYLCFPERDADGKVTAIVTRYPDGQKAGDGHKRGLAIADPQRPGAPHCVEGATDVCAAWDMGVNAVGRPNNATAAALLASYFGEEDVLIVGENDAKPDGAWPGRSGSIAVATELTNAVGQPRRWALPPDQIKDVRVFWIQRRSAGVASGDAGRELLAHLETHAVVVPPADSPKSEPTPRPTRTPEEAKRLVEKLEAARAKSASPADLTEIKRRMDRAKSGEWKNNPTNPAHEDIEWEPFPLDVFTPKVQRILKNAAECMGVDVSMLALPVLVMFAGVIGNSRRLVLKRGYTCPAILWGAIIVVSGGGKSPALQFGSRPLYRLYRRAVKEHRDAAVAYHAKKLAYDADHKANGDNAKTSKPKEPILARVVIDNITTEAVIAIHEDNPRGLCVVKDELGGWVAGFDAYRAKGTKVDMPIWEEFWNGGPIVNDRKGSTKAERHRVYIPRSAVSVVGGIQPATMMRVLTPEHFESGLVARILPVMPPERIRTWSEQEAPEQDEADLDFIVDRLYELAPDYGSDGELEPKYIGMSLAAKAVYVKFFNQHNAAAAELHGNLKAAWTKVEGSVGRLALVLHLSRWAAGESGVTPDKVDEASVANAIRLAHWFGHESRRVYAMLDEGFAKRADRELIAVIERLGGQATIRQVMQAASRFRDSAEEVELMLNRLVREGRGEWNYEPTGGREKAVFVLKPSNTSG